MRTPVEAAPLSASETMEITRQLACLLVGSLSRKLRPGKSTSSRHRTRKSRQVDFAFEICLLPRDRRRPADCRHVS